MKNQLIILLLFFKILIFVQDKKVDSFFVLISNTSTNIEKAKLLIKRSKVQLTINLAEAEKKALNAMKILQAENDDKITIDYTIPFRVRIYCNKKLFFPFCFKIKINRNDAMLDFSFSNKEKNLHFLLQ